MTPRLRVAGGGSVDTVTSLRAGRPRYRVRFSAKANDFLSSKTFRPALRPKQHLVQWMLGIRWLGREAVHSPLPSTKVNIGGCSSTSRTFMACTRVIGILPFSPTLCGLVR